MIRLRHGAFVALVLFLGLPILGQQNPWDAPAFTADPKVLHSATAQQYAVKVVDELRPQQDDFQRSAWMALFTGRQLEHAIEYARRATQEAKEKDRTLIPLPALAALYAETGRSVEARTALLNGIDSEHRGTLRDGDWYVLGRIAENGLVKKRK